MRAANSPPGLSRFVRSSPDSRRRRRQPGPADPIRGRGLALARRLAQARWLHAATAGQDLPRRPPPASLPPVRAPTDGMYTANERPPPPLNCLRRAVPHVIDDPRPCRVRPKAHVAPVVPPVAPARHDAFCAPAMHSPEKIDLHAVLLGLHGTHVVEPVQERRQRRKGCKARTRLQVGRQQALPRFGIPGIPARSAQVVPHEATRAVRPGEEDLLPQFLSDLRFVAVDGRKGRLV